ncbi:MAG: hypothetical protein ABFD50_16670 [Smithella sp.]
MKKTRNAKSSVDKYLVSFSIEEILQDARLVLESKDMLCCKALAGTILVTKDRIESSKVLDELNEIEKEVTMLNDRINQYRIKVMKK